MINICNLVLMKDFFIFNNKFIFMREQSGQITFIMWALNTGQPIY